eukprot:NODE_506_length_6690_cov_0.762858.p7 type:complete len:112 gc:universal NODE_506_length_6690_cov_0.762858:3613-3278(-)
MYMSIFKTSSDVLLFMFWIFPVILAINSLYIEVSTDWDFKIALKSFCEDFSIDVPLVTMDPVAAFAFFIPVTKSLRLESVKNMKKMDNILTINNKTMKKIFFFVETSSGSI